MTEGLKPNAGRLKENEKFNSAVWVSAFHLGEIYISNGIYSFSEFSKSLLEDMGGEIRPWIRSIWEALKLYPKSIKLSDAQIGVIIRFAGIKYFRAKAKGILYTLDDFNADCKSVVGEANFKKYKKLLPFAYAAASNFSIENEKQDIQVNDELKPGFNVNFSVLVPFIKYCAAKVQRGIDNFVDFAKDTKEAFKGSEGEAEIEQWLFPTWKAVESIANSPLKRLDEKCLSAVVEFVGAEFEVGNTSIEAIKQDIIDTLGQTVYNTLSVDSYVNAVYAAFAEFYGDELNDTSEELDAPDAKKNKESLDFDLLILMIKIGIAKMQHGSQNFWEFSESIMNGFKENSIELQSIEPLIYSAWRAAKSISDSSLNRFSEKSFLLAMKIINDELGRELYPFNDIKERLREKCSTNEHQIFMMKDYLNAAYEAMIVLRKREDTDSRHVRAAKMKMIELREYIYNKLENDGCKKLKQCSLEIPNNVKPNSRFDATILTPVIKLAIIDIQHGIGNFEDFAKEIKAESKEHNIKEEDISPWLYPSWKAAKGMMNSSIDKINDKLLLASMDFVGSRYQNGKTSIDDIKNEAKSLYGEDVYIAAKLDDYFNAANDAVVSFFNNETEFEETYEDNDDTNEIYEEESRELAEMWRWKDPEKADKIEAETGKNLETIARERIKIADRNMESILETMNNRTEEKYRDNPIVMKQELQWNRMTALEMRQEELKDL